MSCEIVRRLRPDPITEARKRRRLLGPGTGRRYQVNDPQGWEDPAAKNGDGPEKVSRPAVPVERFRRGCSGVPLDVLHRPSGPARLGPRVG